MDVDRVRQRFQACDQGHVFEYWDTLTVSQQAALLHQTSALSEGLADLVEGQRKAVAALDAVPDAAEISAPEPIGLPQGSEDERRLAEARDTGLGVLRDGRVAMCVVAGGQGTRLGFEGPKGAYPLGPVSDRCLFALQAQKIRGLARRAGCRIPWYVMTSAATDAATRALFEDQGNFGLNPDDVFIFSQGMLPAWDFEGRLILSEPHRIAESPNGHGGAPLALAVSGALEDMEARGIDRLFYYQVDNPLIRMGDAAFVGLHEEMGSEMSCKVIRKREAADKMGVVAEVRGRPTVIEYTEIPPDLRDLRGDDGELVYWAGNIAIHLFNRDFLRRIAAESERCLPFHASPKAIGSVDSDAKNRASVVPNGYKLERFVFDALPWAERTCLMEVRAEEEFSPIKNAEGKDSPESSRAQLVARYRSWLGQAGIEVPPGVEAIEVDHSVIDSPGDVTESGFSDLADAGKAILVSTGSTGTGMDA